MLHEPAPAERVKVELPPEALGDDSLSRLRVLMADSRASLFERVAAAESVLSFELAPAALAGMPSTAAVASTAYRFFQAVAVAAETPSPLRLKALRALAAIENARASRTDPAAIAAERELVVQLVNSQRRAALMAAGAWPAAGNGWRLTMAAAAKMDDEALRQLLEPATQA